MSEVMRCKLIKKTVVTAGMAMIVIGVVLVALSENILPIGVFFLLTGSVAVLSFLMSTLVKCIKMPANQSAATTEGQAGPREGHQEGTLSIYEVPTYEEVVAPDFRPPLGIWIISPSLQPPPLGEPPPYSVVADESISPNPGETAIVQTRLPAGRDHDGVAEEQDVRMAHEATTDPSLPLRIIMPPKLQRFKSDIHEVKGGQEVAVHLEPLTPPPTYHNALEDEVFEEAFQAAL
ncbi:uncharacterized protein LOC115078466 [Rhinatrema bivittatum]|uniref:uncharacterized protein LOC115078466 n=1 Tax=Rhinatrema bivittatum TaxID=194408 RepID=UPI0011273B5E|nr:uncharacterized protein LOC115078466 [Rhinatrema bivittatum]